MSALGHQRKSPTLFDHLLGAAEQRTAPIAPPKSMHCGLSNRLNARQSDRVFSSDPSNGFLTPWVAGSNPGGIANIS
jgi:hypothetical protein